MVDGGRLMVPAASPDLAIEPLRLAGTGSTSLRNRGPHQRRAVRGAAGSAQGARSAIPAGTARHPARQAPCRGWRAGRPAPASAAAVRLSQPPALAPPAAGELALLVPEPVRYKPSAAAAERRSLISAPAISVLAAADLRAEAARQQATAAAEVQPRSESVSTVKPLPIPVAHALPAARPSARPGPFSGDLSRPSGSRNLSEVPRFYRSRLDANRSNLAQRAGASPASEQAVERALDWLARHQDADGRWDGGTARYEDATAVPGDDDFTVHCPPGQTCFGECAYWDADTALSGLALLTYLGAGYTHKEGKFAITMGNGLDFLLAQQRPDGDLRGPSKVVGMYCHAMATLALCEAYALSLDPGLREPAERAVAFLVRSRARDGQAWRYAPGAPMGDTSILGWVVMALKSARELGLSLPEQESVRHGTLEWLDRVAGGQDRGLARYQPNEPVTATMTAEAWVCRQFLGTGGPGPASTEAALYVLKHESDKGESNFYYWYYGTLALYQHGGPSWTRWNGRLRDRIVTLQRTAGHQSGSWDPDESMYGAKGGRIYCTAMAALSLEVYYRYLRLYDNPRLPSSADPAAASSPAQAADRSAP